MTAWIDSELKECRFPDQRLGQRFQRLVEQLSGRIGQSIPLACQDWAATKAAYRFFASDRINEADILSGHLQATRARFQASPGTILVLHDTTEFSYTRGSTEAIGVTRKTATGKGKDGRPRLHTACGILMHSSLVVTLEGLPLGVAAMKFWTRKKFKGCNALKKKINPTRVPIEEKESIRWIENLVQSTELLGGPDRCVHVADREGDIYELFCSARDSRTHFLVRTCNDRRAGVDGLTVSDEMREVRVRGLHRIEVHDDEGKASEALLELRFRKLRVRPPIGKEGRYPTLSLTVLFARERGNPRGRERIDWKLVTDLPVNNRREAIEKLEWYAHRWKIETFHKILKSGCKAEELRLRSAERLVNALAVFCILAWRVFWMTMINRASPMSPASVAFTALETRLLDRLDSTACKGKNKNGVSRYVTKLAQLGGYLARRRDAPPGNAVVWRGLCRLTDITLGYTLRDQDVGN